MKIIKVSNAIWESYWKQTAKLGFPLFFFHIKIIYIISIVISDVALKILIKYMEGQIYNATLYIYNFFQNLR